VQNVDLRFSAVLRPGMNKAIGGMLYSLGLQPSTAISMAGTHFASLIVRLLRAVSLVNVDHR
jgi:hypothetical protein